MTASHPQDGVKDERSRKSDAGQDEAAVLLHPPDEPLLQRRVLHRFEFSGNCFSVRAGKECHSLVRLGDTTPTESEISGPKVKPSYLFFGFNFLRESKKMLNVNNSCSNDPSQTKLIFSQPKNGRVSKICTYLVCEL